ncbi:hypothetical protein HPULCUR_006443 [Helicostylum pulchrum]|uniref:Uncharacterized protein n=1 Tax=Helicostylum pulchrum TaxID=562976 RepID=A0ABP9Y2H9_9FUNG
MLGGSIYDPFNNKEVNADEEDEEETDENDEVYVDEDEEEETDDNEEDEIEDDDVPLDIEKNLIINDINISVKINECVRASSHIDKLENQDLLRYNIIDNTPDSSFYVKDLLGKEWELFSASLVQYYSLYNDVSRIKNKVDTITFNCYEELLTAFAKNVVSD